MQGLALLGVDLVDTLDADGEDKLGLSRDVEGVVLLRSTLRVDQVALGFAVLLQVALGTLEDDRAFLFVGLR